MNPADYYDPKADWNRIPEHMRDGLFRYVMRGEPVGGFLTALLDNDLMETFARADDINFRRIGDMVFFLYNCAPAPCWGSKAQREAWQAHEGLFGIHPRSAANA